MGDAEGESQSEGEGEGEGECRLTPPVPPRHEPAPGARTQGRVRLKQA